MAAGAHKSWFHLFRMLLARPVMDAQALQEAATTLEQFLQTASLGEYGARLDMVGSFR